MLIAKIQNNTVISVKHYKEMFPAVSFTDAGPSDAWLERNGCMRVTVFKPHTSTQKLVSVAPYIEDNQVFTVSVEDKTAEEIAADTANLAARMRTTRDKLLADTDWMVIKALETNVALDTAWAQYRQALRDLPTQQGFPNVDLPAVPGAEVQD